MARKYQCTGCGVELEASAVPAGEFTCGVCGAVQTAKAAHDRSVARPLRRMKSRHRLGRSVRLDDPEKARAQARIRAAKAGTTAFSAGVASAIFFFFSFLGSAGAALVALIAGIWSVARLGSLGLGRTEGGDLSPIERVAAKMARRGRREARLGIAIGGLMIGVYVLQFLEAF